MKIDDIAHGQIVSVTSTEDISAKFESISVEETQALEDEIAQLDNFGVRATCFCSHPFLNQDDSSSSVFTNRKFVSRRQ